MNFLKKSCLFLVTISTTNAYVNNLDAATNVDKQQIQKGEESVQADQSDLKRSNPQQTKPKNTYTLDDLLTEHKEVYTNTPGVFGAPFPSQLFPNNPALRAEIIGFGSIDSKVVTLTLKGHQLLIEAFATYTKEKESKEKLKIQDHKIILGERPAAVQTACDKAFERNKNLPSYTLYNGSSTAYNLLGLNDDLVLKNLALNSKRDDIYIIDVGCARGLWGEHAMKILLSEECQKTGKRFHIFSVTGGIECENIKIKKGNVTHRKFNQFKIENIHEEFMERGFYLKNKADLIVSKWTLRHLADPFGTLKRMYSLLTPLQGTLMFNGFMFAFNNSDTIQDFHYEEQWDILAATNAVPLFRLFDDGRDAGHFLLMRNNDQELALPLEYTGEVRPLDDFQCASNVVTVFNNLLSSKGERFFFKKLKNASGHEDGTHDGYSAAYYCDKHNQLSKDLYAYIKRSGMLIRPLY